MNKIELFERLVELLNNGCNFAQACRGVNAAETTMKRLFYSFGANPNDFKNDKLSGLTKDQKANIIYAKINTLTKEDVKRMFGVPLAKIKNCETNKRQTYC